MFLLPILLPVEGKAMRGGWRRETLSTYGAQLMPLFRTRNEVGLAHCLSVSRPLPELPTLECDLTKGSPLLH